MALRPFRTVTRSWLGWGHNPHPGLRARAALWGKADVACWAPSRSPGRWVAFLLWLSMHALAQGPNGTTVAGGNGRGSAASQLFSPSSVSVDGSANIYVCDTSNDRVQKFSLTGLSASPDPVCAGSPLTFTATVGSVRGAYSYTLANGLLSSLTGTASTTAFSQSLPDAAFSGLAGPCCADTPPLMLVPTTSGGQFCGPGVSGSVSYSVSVGGCSNNSQQNGTVNAPAPSSLNLTASRITLTCANSPALLTASGTGTFQWSDNSTSPTLTVSAAGLYSVTLADIDGGKRFFPRYDRQHDISVVLAHQG